MRKRLVCLLSYSALAFAVPQAVTLTDGNLQATATFDVSGSNLILTLTNSSPNDVLVPSNVLTAVFFTLPGVPPLIPVSAVLNSGSQVFQGTTNIVVPGGVVGGEWAYGTNRSVPGFTYAHGISSSGLGGTFGAGDPKFTGPNLAGPANVGGLEYGITSAGDNSSTGNGGITGNPLIKSSVVFTLSGLPAGFVLNNLNGLVLAFQYGTSLSEPRLTPEPGFYGLLALSFAGVFLQVQRRRKHNRIG